MSLFNKIPFVCFCILGTIHADYSESFYYQSLSEEIEALSNRLVSLESFVEKAHSSQSSTQVKQVLFELKSSVEQLQIRQNQLAQEFNSILSHNEDLKNQMKMILATLNKVVSDEDQQYIVQKGDSLEKIARRFNTSMKSLCEKNEIKDGNLIRVGQKLSIPQ